MCILLNFSGSTGSRLVVSLPKALRYSMPIHLKDAKVIYDSVRLVPDKILAVEYQGIRVSAFDCLGTQMRLDVYCSKHVFQKLITWIGTNSMGFPNVARGAQFQAILFATKYHTSDEWEMDDHEWDDVVTELLRELEGQ